MLIIRRMTRELLACLRPIDGACLVGEDVMLRIGRSGFTLGYVPLPRAEWRSFPVDAALQPEALLADESSAMFLAFEGESLVGQAAVSARQNAGWTEIRDLRVEPACRRKGVARALLGALESFSRKAGMQGLRMVVTDDNPVACQFCQHCGFTLQGLDRLAVAYTPAQRQKPMARRACQLFFYQLHQKG